VTVTVSQPNPRPVRPFDLRGIYNLRADRSEHDEDLHWSCERFWCKFSFDECFIRRYIAIELEFEEYDDD